MEPFNNVMAAVGTDIPFWATRHLIAETHPIPPLKANVATVRAKSAEMKKYMRY
jgi:hypothetical protein